MDSNTLLKASCDVIFLKFQKFDKSSELGGCSVKIKGKISLVLFPLMFFLLPQLATFT